MKKFLLTIVTLLSVATVQAGDVLYKTLTFPGNPQTSVSAYNVKWQTTSEGLVWELANINNNNNAWKYIKCGSSKFASVATITTPLIDENITQMRVTYDKVTTGSVNAAYVLVDADTTFKNAKKAEATLKTGEVIYYIDNPAPNLYYRLVIDCQQGSANGFVQISKVELYKEDASVVSDPVFSIQSGNYYDTQKLELKGDANCDIYVSINGAGYVKYTGPLTITASTEVKAYAQKGDVKSNEVVQSYVMATKYTSIADLLKVTPTATGVPVSVTLTNDEIQSIGQYGVYLTAKPNENYFQLYGQGVPATWKAGDVLNGVVNGLYLLYTKDGSSTYEITVIDYNGLKASRGEKSGPDITPASGEYADAQTVTITDPSGNGYTIYYTLDGTLPTEQSILYEGPFTVSKTTTITAITMDDDDNASAPSSVNVVIRKNYAKVSELVKDCTKDKSPVSFLPTNLLVTGVNGSSVYVTDETGSILLYKSGSKLTRGDIISGTITGQLYAFNSLPEIVVDKWDSIKVVSQGNAVVPVMVDASKVTSADANKYVRFEGLTFADSTTVSDKKNYTLTDGTNMILIRDNFNNLSGIPFDTDYKYNVNAFVSPFKEEIQYYVVDANDITVLTDLVAPELAWNAAYALTTKEAGVADSLKFSAKTDGSISFKTSNPQVATVSDAGVITLTGTGFATITATSAKTATYMAGSATLNVGVISSPIESANFTVEDVQIIGSIGVKLNSVGVHGYIVGFADGAYNKDKCVFSAENAIATNILLASNPEETDYTKTIPVQLSTQPEEALLVRNALNLKENPTILGKEVKIVGAIDKYFTTTGLRNAVSYSFLEKTPVQDVTGDGVVDTQDALAIYQFMLEATEGASIEKYDVTKDGVVDTQDVLEIYNYMSGH